MKIFIRRIIALLISGSLLFGFTACGESFAQDRKWTDYEKPVFDSQQRETGKPFIAQIKLSTKDIPIAIADVRDFGATGDGVTDDSGAIQKALTAAAKLGGGVVFIPAGRYRLDGTLVIPTCVTLRGDWVSPDLSPAGSEGTVLLCYDQKGKADGTPMFTMSAGSSVTNLTVIYPEQNPDNPVDYPVTFMQDVGNSMNIENVTIVNPCVGIKIGPHYNILHYIKNVYMSPLKKGIDIDFTPDIGRLENVSISPKYWQENGIISYTKNQKRKIENAMFDNTTGITMARSDWEYMYGVFIENCKIGIELISGEQSAGNGQMNNLSVDNCDIGLRIEAISQLSLAVANSRFTGTKKTTAAILTEVPFKYVVLFNNIVFDGRFENAVLSKGGTTSFANCDFKNWGDGYAVNLDKKSLSMQNCTFEKAAKHIVISKDAESASIIGCDFAKSPDIKNDAGETVLISHEKMDVMRINATSHIYKDSFPKPKSEKIYNVADFGAVADSTSDNTKAFRAALDAARETGGTVYIPAGRYLIKDTLTVPSGVELRGVFDGPCHSTTYGSILFTTQGKGKDEGQSFISLEPDSGVRGFQIGYPEQKNQAVIPYPYAVMGLGRDVWAIDVVFINAYQGIDFGTNNCEGHYISYVSGSPIKTGIFIGGGSESGWVENVHFNPHYWFMSDIMEDRPTPEDYFQIFWYTQTSLLDGIVLGDCQNEHIFNTFAFGANKGIHLINQNGKTASADIIGHGTDGSATGVQIDDCTAVEFVNSQLVTTAHQRTKIKVLKNNTGEARFFNTLTFAQADTAIDMAGGKLLVQQFNALYLKKTPRIFNIAGGEATFNLVYLPSMRKHGSVTEGKLNLLGNIVLKKDGWKSIKEPVQYDASSAQVKTDRDWWK